MGVPRQKFRPGEIFRPVYKSEDVDIPTDFLKVKRDDSKPITVQHIDFAANKLPEYKGCYAVVLDNVLSPSECEDLLRLAELSAGAGKPDVEDNGWLPALVNIGGGREVLTPGYRDSDRIIWDHDEIAARLWGRCLDGDGIRKDLSTHTPRRYRGQSPDEITWKMAKLNRRLRFLRYGPGQFFSEHCDGAYYDPETKERTFFTLHLYLNDAVQAVGPDEVHNVKPRAGDEDFGPLKGGATPFHAVMLDDQLDVDPLAGRVLIFQHANLNHSGAKVLSGRKYTMRSDLLYSRNT